MPVFKHGFLRSEENVFPAIFLHTKCVRENIFIYNFDYLCMVGSITIHVGRCYCLVISNTLVFVAVVIALADVIAIFCVLFLLLRLMFLYCWENIFFRPEEAMFENWQKLVSSNKIDLVQEKITYYITKTR